MAKGEKQQEARQTVKTPQDLHRCILEVAAKLIKTGETGPLTPAQVKWILDQVGETKG